jgi:hypothetical protein
MEAKECMKTLAEVSGINFVQTVNFLDVAFINGMENDG